MLLVFRRDCKLPYSTPEFCELELKATNSFCFFSATRSERFSAAFPHSFYPFSHSIVNFPARLPSSASSKETSISFSRRQPCQKALISQASASLFNCRTSKSRLRIMPEAPPFQKSITSQTSEFLCNRRTKRSRLRIRKSSCGRPAP